MQIICLCSAYSYFAGLKIALKDSYIYILQSIQLLFNSVLMFDMHILNPPSYVLLYNCNASPRRKICMPCSSPIIIITGSVSDWARDIITSQKLGQRSPSPKPRLGTRFSPSAKTRCAKRRVSSRPSAVAWELRVRIYEQYICDLYYIYVTRFSPSAKTRCAKRRVSSRPSAGALELRVRIYEQYICDSYWMTMCITFVL
jgi:hypothetical protein